MDYCVGKDFIVNVARDDQILLMLHYADYPAVLFGEKSLCDKMAKVVAQKEFSLPSFRNRGLSQKVVTF